jgi:hypothetical protein
MKTFAWVVLVAPILVFSQGKKPAVSGRWELDLKKSVNLPASFAGVDSYTFDVSLSHDTLKVDAGLTGSGQTVSFPPFVYVLDGRENYREDTLRGSERWSTSRWSKGGDSILIDTRILLSPGGRPPVKITQRDVWKLADRNTLVITTTQKFAATDSVRNERRIFRKKK